MHTQDLQLVHSNSALGVVLCANIHFAVPIFLVPACIIAVVVSIFRKEVTLTFHMGLATKYALPRRIKLQNS